MASDDSFYRPIMTITEWASVNFDLTALDIAHAHFDRNFESASAETKTALVRQVLRESAAESGALENLYKLQPGESRTIAREDDDWEAVLDDQEDLSARNTFEDIVAALEMAQSWVGDQWPLSPIFIRELHKVACRSQEYVDAVTMVGGQEKSVKRKFRHGEFKTSENYVQMRSGERHVYCPPEQVQSEISKFCDELNSPSFEEASPIIQAAYAHFCLAQIHPFDDGNGRVCRVFSSIFLLKSFRVPLVVYSDRKYSYLQGLEAVHDGNYRILVQDVADRVTATLSELTQILVAMDQPKPDERLGGLLSLMEMHDSVELADANEIQSNLHEKFKSIVDQSLDTIVENSKGKLQHLTSQSTSPTDYFHRDDANIEFVGDLPYDYIPHRFRYYSARNLFLMIQGRRSDLYAHVVFGAGYSEAEGGQFPFAVAASRSGRLHYSDRLGVVKLRYDDCFPTISTSALSRMQTIADAICTSMLETLEILASERFLESGRYLGPQRGDRGAERKSSGS